MDTSKQFIICASVLIAIGSLLCIPKKTQPVGVGVIAGGMTYAFFALVALLM